MTSCVSSTFSVMASPRSWYGSKAVGHANLRSPEIIILKGPGYDPLLSFRAYDVFKTRRSIC